MDRTEKIIAQAQAKKALRADVKARYLTYFFLGALESFVSAMVLENQPLKGSGQKDRIERGTHGSLLERGTTRRLKGSKIIHRGEHERNQEDGFPSPPFLKGGFGGFSIASSKSPLPPFLWREVLRSVGARLGFDR